MELFKSNWSVITAKGDKTVEIDIDGHIGVDWWVDQDEQNTKERMKAELKAIDDIKATKIVVNINSYGGDVNHGLSIHDLLKSNKAEVETRVNGMSASAATIIAQAGDIRTMSDNALYLVHNSSGMVWGNKKELQSTIDSLEKVDATMARIYSKRSGKSSEHFLELMNEDNGQGIWLDADETLENGLIDEVFEPTAIAAKVDFNAKKYGYPSYQNKLSNLNKSKMENNTEEKTDKKVDSFLDKVLAKISPKKAEVVEPSDDDIQAIADATTEQIEAAKAEKDKEIQNLTAKAKEEAEVVAKEVEELKAKLAKAEAKGTVIDSGTEKLDKSKPDVPECSTLASKLFSKFQERNDIKN